MKWAAPLLLLSTLPALAGLLDITALEQANFKPGSELLVEFSVRNYSHGHHAPSPWPTHLGLTILGLDPGLTTAFLPGSTSQYFPGYAFDARVLLSGGLVLIVLTRAGKRFLSANKRAN